MSKTPDSVGSAKTTVDGRDETPSGDVACVTTGDSVTIALHDQWQGEVEATIQGTVVQTVRWVLNGRELYVPRPGGEAAVYKDANSYRIVGTLASTDITDPGAAPSTHKFSMEVTCPH